LALLAARALDAPMAVFCALDEIQVFLDDLLTRWTRDCERSPLRGSVRIAVIDRKSLKKESLGNVVGNLVNGVLGIHYYLSVCLFARLGVKVYTAGNSVFNQILHFIRDSYKCILVGLNLIDVTVNI